MKQPVKGSMEMDENKEGDGRKSNEEESETVQDDKKSTSEKGQESDGSNPMNDVKTKGTNDKTSEQKTIKSIFKNISISVVGGNSKNINLESFFTTKFPPAAPKPTPNIFKTGRNILIKRKSTRSPTKVFDCKRTKKSFITLDERSIIEEISEDEEGSEPKEILAEKFDNCTHGDPTDYMCVDCTYNGTG